MWFGLFSHFEQAFLGFGVSKTERKKSSDSFLSSGWGKERGKRCWWFWFSSHAFRSGIRFGSMELLIQLMVSSFTSVLLLFWYFDLSFLYEEVIFLFFLYFSFLSKIRIALLLWALVIFFSCFMCMYACVCLDWIFFRRVRFLFYFILVRYSFLYFCSADLDEEWVWKWALITD